MITARVWPSVLGLLLAGLALGDRAQAGTLRAGVAKVDITPSAGLAMYGYFSRTAPATGALDPLYARVLVLGVDEKRLALVTLDLGRTFGPQSLTRLRKSVLRSTGISSLVVTASHTHSGPNVLDEYPGDAVPAWEELALERVAKGIERANNRLEEVQLGTGYGEVFIGYNRRQVNPDGTVSMLWSNPEKRPTSPLDPTVAVLRIDRPGGKPLAILVNYACHPVVFGADNTEYSADFPGVMARTVEDAFGGAPLCFFLQGADGDINPYDAGTPFAQGAVARRDWAGRELGREAARVANEIKTEPEAAPALDFSEDVLKFHLRWDPKKFREGLLQTYGPRIFEDHADMLSGTPPREVLELAVTTVLLNKRITVVGMPGEPFVEFQINWRDRCPVPDAFFLGYANGYFDYFPTIHAASEGGYGAADSDTYIEPGAGERMLDLALVRVYQMLGRLSDLPEDLKKK